MLAPALFVIQHHSVNRRASIRLARALARIGRALVFQSANRRCRVNSDVTGGHVDRLHDFPLRRLQAPSVCACDHRACGVVVLSLPAEPSPGRGDAAGARHRRLLRGGATMGDEVRARLCPPPEAQESEPPRYLAPRRGRRQASSQEAGLSAQAHDERQARLLCRRPGARSCPRSSIARTRASITGPRTLTCLCDANGRCRAFDLREACSGSSPSSPPSAISLSRPVPVAPPLPPIFIASTPSRNGRPWPASPPESVRAAEIASPRALVS